MTDFISTRLIKQVTQVTCLFSKEMHVKYLDAVEIFKVYRYKHPCAGQLREL